MHDQKNLFLAIAFSVAIILGFQLLFPQQPSKQTTTGPTAPTAPGSKAPGTTAPGTPGAQQPGGAPTQTRGQALKQGDRVAIDTPRVKGSIALRGGRIDDIVLQGYWQTVKEREHVELLNPADSRSAYFTQFNWYRNGSDAQAILDGSEVWEVVGDNRTLAPDSPVILRLSKGGFVFERTYAIDADYMITVQRKVTNNTGESASLFAGSEIRRYGTPKTLGFFVLHEGPIGVKRDGPDSRGTQEEPSYSTVREKPLLIKESLGGWLGFSGHYWLVALIPEQNLTVNGEITFQRTPGADEEEGWYIASYYASQQTIAAGNSAQIRSRVFAGAKESDLLRAYEENLGISRFEWAIDWGWFWFFTKPFLWLLKFFNDLVGNFGLAILILTVGVKLVFFPLANRSYKSMSRMKKLQPEMMKLRERHKDDKQRMNQEMMALYRREKVNPAAGCWPILVQIPVFFALYKVLFVSIEMRHAPFFGWIEDLSAQDPTSIVNLFGILPWDSPTAGLFTILNIGLLPIIMGITMWLQQKLNPAPPDPMQQKIFMLLPFVFTVMLASFPAGLVLYWAWNNTLSIAQQWVIMKRQGVYGTPQKGPTNVRDLQTETGPPAGGETIEGEAEPAEAEPESDEIGDETGPAEPGAKSKPRSSGAGGAKPAAAKAPGNPNPGKSRTKPGSKPPAKGKGSRSRSSKPRRGGGTRKR